MRTQSIFYPPLTSEDILLLRGKPDGKKVSPDCNYFNPSMEEWIYYHNDIKESYSFRNGRLIRWGKKTISILRRNMKCKLLLLTVILVTGVLDGSADQMDSVKSEYQKQVIELQNNNALDYFQLGKWAKENKLFGPAKQYFNKALELNPDYSEAKEALSKCTNGGLPNNYFELVRECRKKLQEVQQKCANRFAELAKYCKTNNLTDEREYCLSEAIKYDANCKSAREERSEVKTEYFGWVSKPDTDNLKKGLIKANGKWVSQNEIDKLKWEDAYELRSEHYLLRTNIPFNKAQKSLKDLESFYDVILSFFYGIDGFEIPAGHIFKFYYFKTQQEYHAHIEQCTPGYKDLLGCYSVSDNAVHLWQSKTAVKNPERFSPEMEPMCFLHESTHQLLRIATNGYGKDRWVVEGMACAFETLKCNNGKISFGNPTIRIPATKLFISQGNFMHLQDMTDYSKPFNLSPEPRYAQAMSMTLFFLQHEKYKLRFLEYVVAVHKKGDALEKSFGEFMGIDDLAKVDKEWIEFVKAKI
jgi:tetratricopeptide (TPR) repeat protein